MGRQMLKKSWVAGVIFSVLLGLPAVSAAGERASYWLASTGGSLRDSIQGRLVVKDGVLTFYTARAEWSTPLADIKRVSPVKGSSELFQIETVTGDVLRLVILGPQLLTESPKKAIQVIQRAVREARPVLAAAAPAGGGSLR